ncbi:MAG: endonuclease domain-containing protein [Betaproteobacteria bacterium]
MLWFHLRRKQILGITFYRQRPIGPYIVDFYAPAIRLVMEVDGGQHVEPAGIEGDSRRSAFLLSQGLEVVRFDNLQVIKETVQVLEEIYRIVDQRKSLPTSL